MAPHALSAMRPEGANTRDICPGASGLSAKGGTLAEDDQTRHLCNYPREVLLVVGLTMGGTTAFYPHHLRAEVPEALGGLDDTQTTLVTAGSLIFALCQQPVYGALLDKIGCKTVLTWFGVTGTLFTIPLLDALQGTKSAFTAFLLTAAAWSPATHRSTRW